MAEVKYLLRSGEGARALPIIGDRWVLLILRDAFLGARRFEDFRRLTGAARGTLTSRLAALVQQGVLYRNEYRKTPVRHEYRLSEKGMALYPVALALWHWESHWAGAFGLPPRLVHKGCGMVMEPELACGYCGQVVLPTDVTYESGAGAKVYTAQRAQPRRRRQSPDHAAEGVDTTMFHSVDTLGDRWTVLLLACLYFGLHRYDDISAALGIATNILADRLRRLLSAGIVQQHLYHDGPPRYEYRLSTKGWGLYPATLAIHEWATAWIASPSGPALKLRHRPCGHGLRTKMRCNCCLGLVDPHAVGVKPSSRWKAQRGSLPTRS